MNRAFLAILVFAVCSPAHGQEPRNIRNMKDTQVLGWENGPTGLSRVDATTMGIDGVVKLVNGGIDLNGNNINTITPTELGCLSGVTSAIQTQIDGKLAIVHSHLEADVTDLDKYTQAEIDAKTWAANDVVSGTFANARISQSSVTQYQAALSITESQISDLQNYLTGVDNLADGAVIGWANGPPGFSRTNLTTAAFDGSLTTTGTVNGRTMATDGAKLDSIEAAATADQTAAEILASLLTVDGTGTLLDADLLDGVEGAAFGLVASPLSQFAATTADQLRGVISDATGTGALVFGTSPVFTTQITTPQIATAAGDLTLAPVGAVAVSGDVTVSEDIVLTNTTSTNLFGIIYKGANTYIHNFQHATGATAIPEGNNLFIGESAGNLTIGSTATSTYHSSNNFGLGYGAASSLTTGNRNTAIGSSALHEATTGSNNIAIGYNAMAEATNSRNVVVGTRALSSGTGSDNTLVGYVAGESMSSGRYNTGLGGKALNGLTTGEYNTAVGYQPNAGVTTGSRNTLIGANITGLSPSLSNTIILADGAGSQKLEISSSDVMSLKNGANPTEFRVYEDVTDGIDSYLALTGDTISTAGASGGALRLTTVFGDLTLDPAADVDIRANSVTAATFDDSSTAGNTRLLLYDVDNGTLERVTVGAADSGGSGYKVLRIPN